MTIDDLADDVAEIFNVCGKDILNDVRFQFITPARYDPAPYTKGRTAASLRALAGEQP